MNQLTRVTFGFVNCNRLHYLKSCLESLLECTHDYQNKEIIVVDNASVEQGTDDYLTDLQNRNFTVIKIKKRDCNNEFAKALNTIVEKSTGDLIAPLQGDMQFVVRGKWLHDYIEFFEANYQNVGCMTLDAQRRTTNSSHRYSLPNNDKGHFLFDIDRAPISGAADAIYSRKILDMIGPWNCENSNHETSGDSETKMLMRVREISQTSNFQYRCIVPRMPVAISINTDKRGTNARIRGNKRYGDYWPAKSGYTYYKIINYDNLIERSKNSMLSIEDIVDPVGFEKFVDENGDWRKNPIRPETATTADFTVIDNSEDTLVINNETHPHPDESRIQLTAPDCNFSTPTFYRSR